MKIDALGMVSDKSLTEKELMKRKKKLLLEEFEKDRDILKKLKTNDSWGSEINWILWKYTLFFWLTTNIKYMSFCSENTLFLSSKSNSVIHYAFLL